MHADFPSLRGLPRAAAVPTLACLAALLAGAPGAAAGVTGEADVSFAATSTFHDFEGEVPPVAFALQQDEGGSWSADLSVPVAGIDTGIERRNASMREMLDASHYPEIRGRFRAVDPEAVRQSGVLPFALVIRDQERPMEAHVSSWQQDESHASFDADFDVSLEAFQLKAPRVLFIRVGDVVHVRVHVALERAQAAEPPAPAPEGS
jgi:polyisoprenoid-binding protein YceI